MALVAIGSKETAFALIPALLLVLLGSRARGYRSRLFTVGAVILVAIRAISCRFAALNGWKGDENLPLSATVIGSGMVTWLANLPGAVQTHHGHFALAALGLVAFAAFLLSRGERAASRQRSVSMSIAALLVLLVGIVMAQSPIALTALPALPVNGVLLPTVSLRFFYAPRAVLSIIAVALFSRLTFKSLWLVWTLRLSVVAAVVIATLGSARQTEIWAKNTSAEAQDAATAIAEYASIAQQHKSESPCLVRLASTPSSPDIDLRFKASIESDDPRINCALLTQPPQAQTITRIGKCQRASLLPARSTIAGREPWLRSGTCTFFFLGE